MIDYEIIKIDLFFNEMRVKYSQTDKEDYYLWINFGNAPNVTEEFLHAEAVKMSVEASTHWKQIEEKENKSKELEESMATKTGTAKPWVFDDPPEYNELSHEIRDIITEEETCMRKSWETVELTNDQRAVAIRMRRSLLLQDTDTECLSDRSPTTELLTYRQALRDIPQQEGFPTSVEWPIKPSEG